MRCAVIVSTARTPIGRAYRGAFNDTPVARRSAAMPSPPPCERAGVDGARWRTSSSAPRCSRAAQGWQHRAAGALRAGLPDSVAGMTMDRQCASGLMAIATAAKQIIDDDMQIVVGGGVEIDLPGADASR